jgi:elongation factor Ts
MDVRKALEESAGDIGRAEEILKEMGATRAETRVERATGSGLVETYTHGDGRVGVMVEVGCETDFVSRTDEFKTLAHEITLQIAAMSPSSVDELLNQEYIRDPGRKISDLVRDAASKTGENIKIKRFERYVLGS